MILKNSRNIRIGYNTKIFMDGNERKLSILEYKFFLYTLKFLKILDQNPLKFETFPHRQTITNYK